MNKKIIILMISIAMIVALILGIFIVINNDKTLINEKAIEYENNSTTNTNANPETINHSKILVVFFSKAGGNYSVGNVEVGNTEIMAKNIKEMVGADLFKIEPINEYPDDYNEATEVATEEQKNNARPEIKNKISNIDEYDTIFIGYPIWWDDMPQIIYTFLESYNFSGKTIIPFNTHEGSGDAGTYNTIKSKLSKSNVLEGLAVRGTEARKESSKETIQSWLNSIGF